MILRNMALEPQVNKTPLLEITETAQEDGDGIRMSLRE